MEHVRRPVASRSTLGEPTATPPQIEPGKRTLTDAVAMRQPEAHAGSGSVAPRGISRSVPAPPASAPCRASLPLQRLFGVPPAATELIDHPGPPQAAAARGTATPATTLPYADRIQRAFGGHDISGIRAHIGSEAAASARDIGARAYATGDHVVLGEDADLHTVAHEAAHVIQQRSGVQLKGGIGEVGDAHERQADEVADRVVRGDSAEASLPTLSNRSTVDGAAPVQCAIYLGGKPDPEPTIPEDIEARASAAGVLDLLRQWLVDGTRRYCGNWDEVLESVYARRHEHATGDDLWNSAIRGFGGAPATYVPPTIPNRGPVEPMGPPGSSAAPMFGAAPATYPASFGSPEPRSSRYGSFWNVTPPRGIPAPASVPSMHGPSTIPRPGVIKYREPFVARNVPPSHLPTIAPQGGRPAITNAAAPSPTSIPPRIPSRPVTPAPTSWSAPHEGSAARSRGMDDGSFGTWAPGQDGPPGGGLMTVLDAARRLPAEEQLELASRLMRMNGIGAPVSPSPGHGGSPAISSASNVHTVSAAAAVAQTPEEEADLADWLRDLGSPGG